MVWLAVECLPLLVWRSWRDTGSGRLRWSWTVLVPMFISVVNLSDFNGWHAARIWAGTMDVLGQTLLLVTNEELLCRGYMFHDRPWRQARRMATVLVVSFLGRSRSQKGRAKQLLTIA